MNQGQHGSSTRRELTLRITLRLVAMVCAGALSAHCAMGVTPSDGLPDAAPDTSSIGIHRGDAAGGDASSSSGDGAAVGDDAAVPMGPIADASLAAAYLPDRRTFDQEREYIVWTGDVRYVSLTHRDGTSLPADEGGASCNSTCTEQVTRIGAGGSIEGNFADLSGFRVQLASESDPGVGTAVVEACGTVIGMYSLGGASGTAGFNNFPLDGPWPVPSDAPCTWRIRAVGGFVDVRAVTPTYRTAVAPPTVDLRVNDTNGPLTLQDPADYVLSWTSTNAVSCVASGAWSGGQASTGAASVHGQHVGRYAYTITCENSLGSASDEVVVNVQAPPG